MGNTYDASNILADPSATVAGKQIQFTTPDRMAQSINYSFATGACHNVLSQAYSDKVFIQDNSSLTEMSQWRIPLASLEHSELEIVVNYRLHGTSSSCNAKFILEIGASSANVTMNLPSTSNGIVNNSITISMPGSNEYYGTLTLQVQGDGSTADVEIFTVMARWKRIASPISAGKKNQYTTTEFFKPFGTTRTDANNALSSRFGYNMIDNIDIMRKRFKSYLTWSGVYSASSNQFPSLADAAASVIYIGAGHVTTLLSYPMLPSGWEELTGNKLQLHVKAIGDVTFDFMGNEIVVDQATSTTVGWSIFELTIDQVDLSEIGDINLPYYEARLDSSDQNYSSLGRFVSGFTTKYPTVDSGNTGAILGLTLMGI